MRMRSPRIEPPENGLDGSIATMPTLRRDARTAAASFETSVDLPLPGTPVMPTTCARPARAKSASSAGRASAAPDSARVRRRAMARTSPASTPATRSCDGRYATASASEACVHLAEHFTVVDDPARLEVGARERAGRHDLDLGAEPEHAQQLALRFVAHRGGHHECRGVGFDADE